MQFEGRIKKIVGTLSGTSAAGKEWTKQDFVFEFFENPNDRFSDSVALSIMNERIKEYDIHEGENVIIGFGHRTREYQGRYFNDIYIYHFEKVKQVVRNEAPAAQPSPAIPTAPASATPTQTVAQQQPAQGDDQLPF